MCATGDLALNTNEIEKVLPEDKARNSFIFLSSFTFESKSLDRNMQHIFLINLEYMNTEH